MARKLLGELGLAGRMAAIIGGDTLGPGKRKPSPAPILAMIEQSGGGRATFVGDSIYDVMAAKAAATASIVVGFGFLARPAEPLGHGGASCRGSGVWYVVIRGGAVALK